MIKLREAMDGPAPHLINQWDVIQHLLLYWKLRSLSKKMPQQSLVSLLSPSTVRERHSETHSNVLPHYRSTSFVEIQVYLFVVGGFLMFFFTVQVLHSVLSCSIVFVASHWLPWFPKMQTNSSDKQTVAIDPLSSISLWQAPMKLGGMAWK